ncbi:hypothetical protein RhiirA4_547293 [Rhizophagus irregularis]|uniref:DUF6826 domain-containing protein n=1 Tax=Rhizophagus irregularis TaxID=588596 RepID=A0A2I1H1C7_9GLOM|nr:hypothetical protein RhiirA4_547293 [Rhizophagus irregularis]
MTLQYTLKLGNFREDPYIDKFSIKISTGTNINLLKTAVREDIKVPDLMVKDLRGLKNENNSHIIIRLPTVPWRISQAYLVKWDVSGSSTSVKGNAEDYKGTSFSYTRFGTSTSVNPTFLHSSGSKTREKLIRTSIERYLREHLTPTSTEEVQNWFNGLMMELPSFKRKLLVESTHNDPYLDGFKPHLSVFLEDDAKDRTHIPMLVQMLLRERQILYITWKVHKNTSEVVFRHLQQYTNKIDYNDIPAALKYSQHQDLQHEAEIIRFLNGRNII